MVTRRSNPVTRKLCFDFVAIVFQWQAASDEDWALALAREAVIRLLTDGPMNRK
jgi:hypothetical protein